MTRLAPFCGGMQTSFQYSLGAAWIASGAMVIMLP